MLDTWRLSWRISWAPGYTDGQLAALAEALACDDARLAQSKTVCPVPCLAREWENCCQACPLAAALWLPLGPLPPDIVDELWTLAYFAAEERAPADDPLLAWRLVAWVDDEDWETVVRPGLLGEVSRTLGMRALGQRDMTVVMEAEEGEPVVVLFAS